MSTWKGLASYPRSIIPSTNPCLDQPDGSPPTGKTFWWNRDDAMGRDRLGGSGSPPNAEHRARVPRTHPVLTSVASDC